MHGAIMFFLFVFFCKAEAVFFIYIACSNIHTTKYSGGLKVF